MNSIFKKLIFRFIIISLIIIIFMGFTLIYFFKGFYFSIKEQEIIQNSKPITNYLSQSIAEGNSNDTNIWLKTLAEVNTGQAWLIDKSGKLKMSYPYFTEEGTKINLEVYKEIFKGNIISQRVETNYFEKPMLLIGIPIKNNDSIEYSLLIFTSVEGINSTIRQVRQVMIYSGLIAILLALLISYTLSKSFSKPLKNMSKVALKLSEGNFNKKIKVNSNDELGTLAESMNYMSDKLKSTIDNLHKEKNKLEKILIGMEEGVLVIDSKYKIVLFNDSVKNLLNFVNPSEQKNLYLTNSLEKNKVINSFKKSLEEKETITRELNIYDEKEKIDKRILLHCSPIYIQNNYCWGVVGLFQDITKRWKFEQLQKDFVANVSHELKTPLSSIKGSAEILLDNILKNPKKEEEYLKTIIKETNRLEGLVNKILDLSELEAADFNFNEKLININKLIKNIVGIFKKDLYCSNRKLNIVLPEKDFYIKASKERLKQVLLNLIDNAHKFSDETEIIEIGAKKVNNEIKVWIKDNGIGIPKNELNNIWNRFYKIDKARRPSNKGSGLGLAIVKEIIEQNGGKVFAKSTLGEGSTFGFYLPLKES
ncbi:MAG: ATP-binding protein [Bacillota bacterium]